MGDRSAVLNGSRARAALICIAVLALAVGTARAQAAVPMHDRDGDNTIFFTWDAEAGRVTQATSGGASLPANR